MKLQIDPRELWRAWRDGRDELAFEDLVSSELRYAADYARRLGASTAEADDVVQDALLLLARERSDAPVRVGVRAWLCRRVSLGFRMHVRSSVRRRRREQTASSPRAEEEPGRRLERRDAVEAALGGLGERERRAIVLRYLHDMDYAEMAYVLGTSENACRLRVHKGLKRLRERLGARAATMVGLLGVPAITTKAALVSSAVGAAATTAGTATATALGAKAAAAVAATVLAVGAATTVLVLPGSDEPAPAPAPVVAQAPTSAPPPPAPTPALPVAAAAFAPVPFETAIDLLEAHLGGGYDATAAMWRFDEIARLVGGVRGPTEKVEAAGSITDLDLRARSRTAGRIVLGPGRFRLARGVYSEDQGRLEIVGAGMDRTVLIAPETNVLHVREEHTFHGLVIRDLTFEGDTTLERRSGGLLDVRGRAAALFERVRFRAWDDLTGYGAPVGSQGGRILTAFRDCEFIGGCRRRARGAALAVRGPSLYLFDGCRFSDLDAVVSDWTEPLPPDRSLGHFRGCDFDNARLTRRAFDDAEAPYPIRIRGSTVRFGLAQEARTARLERWGARLTVKLDAALEPEPVRCRLGQLRRVLEEVEPPIEHRIVAIEALTWEGCNEPRYVIHAEERGGARHAILVRRDGGRTRPVVERDVWVPGRPPIQSVQAGPTLLTALVAAWSDLDPSTPAGGVSLDRAGRGVVVLDRFLAPR